MVAPRSAAQDGWDRSRWLTLSGACVGIFSGSASVAYYTFGVFLPEIVASTHWTGQRVAAATGPALLAAAIIGPLVGWATDRYGARLVALVGAPSAAAGFLILGWAPQSAGEFSAALTLLFVLYFAGSPVPYARLVSAWFGERRGAALGVMFAFGSLGIACWPQYAAVLIARHGWRTAYVIVGSTAAALLFSAALFLIRDPPRAASFQQRPAEAGLSVRDALGTARFWKLAVVFLTITAVLGGLAVVFPMLLRTRHATPEVSASVMAAVALGMLLGRLVTGALLDRYFGPTLTILVTCVSLASFALIMATAGVGPLFLAAGFLGLSLGSEYSVAAYMVSRAFGLASFGSIYGLITAATSLGAAAGPAVLGSALVSGTGVATICLYSVAALAIPLVLLRSLKRKDFPFGEKPIQLLQEARLIHDGQHG